MYFRTSAKTFYTFFSKKMSSMRARLQFLFLILMVLGILSLLFTYNMGNDIRLCFVDPLPLIQQHVDGADGDGNGVVQQYSRLEDVLLAEKKPIPGRSIFFHETSCLQQPKSRDSHNVKIVKLSKRQACAIESAALHNPNLNIFVLFASPVYIDNNATQPLIDAILTYPNVNLRNLNLWTYAAETPVNEWLKNGDLFRSSYVFSHVSDFLRYLSLWRWGGTYLDMDIVMLRSIEDIPPNFTGAESKMYLAAGVMNFAADGFGHQIAEHCLHDFKRNFKGDDWGYNGPGVITRVMQTVCGTKNIQLMFNPKRCLGFQVFPRDKFYAIPWVEWERFFEADYLNETLQLTKNSYVIHVWNKHSHKRQIVVGSNVAYGKIAEKNCPKVYKASGEFF